MDRDSTDDDEEESRQVPGTWERSEIEDIQGWDVFQGTRLDLLHLSHTS